MQGLSNIIILCFDTVLVESSLELRSLPQAKGASAPFRSHKLTKIYFRSQTSTTTRKHTAHNSWFLLSGPCFFGVFLFRFLLVLSFVIVRERSLAKRENSEGCRKFPLFLTSWLSMCLCRKNSDFSVIFRFSETFRAFPSKFSVVYRWRDPRVYSRSVDFFVTDFSELLIIQSIKQHAFTVDCGHAYSRESRFPDARINIRLIRVLFGEKVNWNWVILKTVVHLRFDKYFWKFVIDRFGNPLNLNKERKTYEIRNKERKTYEKQWKLKSDQIPWRKLMPAINLNVIRTQSAVSFH